MVIVPPYCGVPRLSHQFPVAVVVTAAVAVVVVATAVAVVVVVVMVWFDVVVLVIAVVVVVDDEPQDASIIVAGINKHKANQIILFFNLALLFLLS